MDVLVTNIVRLGNARNIDERPVWVVSAVSLGWSVQCPFPTCRVLSEARAPPDVELLDGRRLPRKVGFKTVPRSPGSKP